MSKSSFNFHMYDQHHFGEAREARNEHFHLHGGEVTFNSTAKYSTWYTMNLMQMAKYRILLSFEC